MEGTTTKNRTTTGPTSRGREIRLAMSLETLGEIILLVLVGAFLIYLFIESLQWPLGSALMPWIAVAIGMPFWAYRLLVLVLRAREEPGQIMDIGFRTGNDPENEKGRFLRIALFILGLYLGIWLFGFHVALPLGMLIYVRVYGQLSWFGSLCVGLMFLALLIGVYDSLLNATWHEPLVWQWYQSLP